MARRRAVWDPSVGRYKVLVGPGAGKRVYGPGHEPPLTVEVNHPAKWSDDLKQLRKAKSSDYARQLAASADLRTVAIIAGAGLAVGVAWEIAAMISEAVAGFDPANIFGSNDKLGGLSLADLNPIFNNLGSAANSSPTNLIPQLPVLPFPLEPVV